MDTITFLLVLGVILTSYAALAWYVTWDASRRDRTIVTVLNSNTELLRKTIAAVTGEDVMRERLDFLFNRLEQQATRITDLQKENDVHAGKLTSFLQRYYRDQRSDEDSPAANSGISEAQLLQAIQNQSQQANQPAAISTPARFLPPTRRY